MHINESFKRVEPLEWPSSFLPKHFLRQTNCFTFFQSAEVVRNILKPKWHLKCLTNILRKDSIDYISSFSRNYSQGLAGWFTQNWPVILLSIRNAEDSNKKPIKRSEWNEYFPQYLRISPKLLNIVVMLLKFQLNWRGLVKVWWIINATWMCWMTTRVCRDWHLKRWILVLFIDFFMIKNRMWGCVV